MKRGAFYSGVFIFSLPAKMSCKLWLNVWTCRSFTCPFTLRNLDRNPTAALISGFIVPRAQRVCIEKATATVRARLLLSTCLSDCSSPLLGDPVSLALAVYLLAFICRGRGKLVFRRECQDGSVLGDKTPVIDKCWWRLCVLGKGGLCCHVDQALPPLFPPPE